VGGRGERERSRFLESFIRISAVMSIGPQKTGEKGGEKKKKRGTKKRLS